MTLKEITMFFPYLGVRGEERMTLFPPLTGFLTKGQAMEARARVLDASDQTV
jgi:hypothetical protein